MTRLCGIKQCFGAGVEWVLEQFKDTKNMNDWLKEEIVKAAYDKGYAEAENDTQLATEYGWEQGFAACQADNYQTGKEDGYKDGFDKGYEAGYQFGLKRSMDRSGIRKRKELNNDSNHRS